ncbi:hypothetical protein L6258_02715, partial [Candidatus Parcubacteria bacterium]|nr:hypothetical protein [Candidatus Parcubacteria bacterium]
MGLKKPLSPEKDQNTEGIQVPVDPTTPESTELAQPKSKKWLTVGLAAVAGLAVVATVFLTYQKLQLKKQSSQPAPTPAATSPTIQPDETADWKTYRNERGGYQYSYPSDWQNDEPCPSFTGPECGDGPQNGSFAHPRNYQYPDGNFWVEYFSNTSCQEIDYLNWPEQWSWEEVDKTEELISGVVATAYEGRIGGIGHTDDQIYDRKYLAMDHQGTCYKIDLASYQNTQHWRLLNQILSTFKFTEATAADSSVDWDAYE